MVNKILDGKGNFGYNAQTGEYGDMMEMGVLDPTKVTRTALQNASSVAGLMLTTECMVADLPEDKGPSMPPGGGGMGGMGGHGLLIPSPSLLRRSPAECGAFCHCTRRSTRGEGDNLRTQVTSA